MRQNQYRRWGHDLVGVFFCALGCLALLAAPVTADPETTEQAPPTLTEEARNVRGIIHLVWMGLFQRYYWLKERDQQNKS